MNIKELEYVLNALPSLDKEAGYLALKAAVKDYISSQKVYPVAPKKEPGKHDHSEFFKRLRELNRRSGCPACGAPDGVPHYCPGPGHRGNTGIEYWMNQPTAMGVAHGQRVGGFGAGISGAEG